MTEEPDPRESEEDRKKRIEEEERDREDRRRRGWYTMVYSLAGGSLLAMREVLGRGAVECFAYLTFEMKNRKVVTAVKWNK